MNRPDLRRVRPAAWIGEPQRMLLLAVLIGVCTGLVVVCFHAAIDLLDVLIRSGARTSVARLLWPAAGAAVAAAIVWRWPVGGGSGIVQTKAAVYVSDGRIPLASVPAKFASCVVSIGSGTPLGPEDPALLMGAGIASRLGRVFGLSRASMRLIAPTGAAAGIAAAFNTPITGVLFVLEEVVAGFDAAVMGAIVLAAASAVVVSRTFLGESPLFSVPALAALGSGRDVLACVGLGLASGLVATAYVRGMGLVRYRIGAVRLPAMVGPAVAGLVIGAVGLAWPDVLGTGYHAMDGALHEQYPWTTMAGFAALKVLVAGLAFGVGTPGGLFAPTLFVGVMLGGAFAGAPGVLPLVPGMGSALALAGMAGLFAGVFRAPMTAVFMAFELSGSPAAILPAMITSTLGFLVSRQLHRQSILDLVAEHEGAVFPSARAVRSEVPLHVEDAWSPASAALVVPSSTSQAAVSDAVAASEAAFVLVPSGTTHWLVLTRAEALAHLAATTWPPETRAARPAIEAVYPDEWLDAALRRLASAPVVPVVSRLEPRRLLGVVSAADVRRAYGYPPEPRPADALADRAT